MAKLTMSPGHAIFDLALRKDWRKYEGLLCKSSVA
jgi:hypothetical protein